MIYLLVRFGWPISSGYRFYASSDAEALSLARCYSPQVGYLGSVFIFSFDGSFASCRPVGKIIVKKNVKK